MLSVLLYSLVYLLYCLMPDEVGQQMPTKEWIFVTAIAALYSPVVASPSPLSGSMYLYLSGHSLSAVSLPTCFDLRALFARDTVGVM